MYMSRIKGQQHLSSLYNSKLGIHTWKISAVIKATVRKQSQITKSREAAYKDATGCRYWSIRKLTDILPPPVLFMISA